MSSNMFFFLLIFARMSYDSCEKTFTQMREGKI